MKRLFFICCALFLMDFLPVAGGAQTSASASAMGVRPHLSVHFPIPAVAAENFYGDILAQLGGEYLAVTSVLSQPNQDPHLFEASPVTARRVATARLVIYNGAAYDPWMAKLLAASPTPQRMQIDAAALIGMQAGDNPHVWYLPTAIPAVAKAIHAFLIHIDFAHQRVYDARLADFLYSLKPIDVKIAALRAKYQGLPVTATEPVFDYMANAIGLKMRNMRFQRSVMNNTEPSIADRVAFEKDLRQQHVKLLIYNRQTSDPIAHRMCLLAQRSGIAVVPVTETQPAGLSYQQWMFSQLDTLERALRGHAVVAQECQP